jgi:hypothetical protein
MSVRNEAPLLPLQEVDERELSRRLSIIYRTLLERALAHSADTSGPRGEGPSPQEEAADE